MNLWYVIPIQLSLPCLSNIFAASSCLAQDALGQLSRDLRRLRIDSPPMLVVLALECFVRVQFSVSEHSSLRRDSWFFEARSTSERDVDSLNQRLLREDSCSRSSQWSRPFLDGTSLGIIFGGPWMFQVLNSVAPLCHPPKHLRCCLLPRYG